MPLSPVPLAVLADASYLEMSATGTQLRGLYSPVISCDKNQRLWRPSTQQTKNGATLAVRAPMLAAGPQQPPTATRMLPFCQWNSLLVNHNEGGAKNKQQGVLLLLLQESHCSVATQYALRRNAKLVLERIESWYHV